MKEAELGTKVARSSTTDVEERGESFISAEAVKRLRDAAPIGCLLCLLESVEQGEDD